ASSVSGRDSFLVNPLAQSQLERARRLVAHEAGAGRVYDRLHEHLAHLVGEAGVDALFARSASLVQGEFAGLARSSIFERAAALRSLVHSEALAPEPAIALFATFLSLLTTFIGERLTIQVLRSAWPTLEMQRSGENPP